MKLLKEKLNNIFIFESDVEINDNLDDLEFSINDLKEVDWSLFFLGGVPHNVLNVYNKHLLNGTMCQHIHMRLMENILMMF